MPLKIVKRKGSPYWYVRGSIRGREIFESTQEIEKDAAEKYRISYEHELIQTAKVAEHHLVMDAVEAYLSKGGEERYLDKIVEAIGLEPLDHLTQEFIDMTARQLYPTQAASSVKRWFYVPLSSVLNYAAELGWCQYRKINKPKVKRPPPQWAEMDWFEAIWPHCNPQLLALTTFLPYTGSRITEALNLTWDHVNLGEGWAYIEKTKNGQPRMVHLPEIVIQRLLPIQKKSGPVFHWAGKDAVNWAVRRLVNKVNKIREEGGLKKIPYLSSHKFGSHTYATWMRRYAGMDSAGLVATGRWKSPASTFIYAHANPTQESKKSGLLPVPVQK